MTDKRTLGQGDVPITLTDPKGEVKNFVLKPSLHAVRILSRKYGGLMPLVDRIGKIEFDVILDVIHAGMQLPPNNPKAFAELEDLVYHSGMSDSTGNLPGLCVRYVTILAHGGRPPPEDAKPETDSGNVLSAS